jgi:hypothetical protein
MIVSTTLASATLVVADCDDVGGGGGDATSLVGMFPAKVVTDISPVRATATLRARARFSNCCRCSSESSTVAVLASCLPP